MTRHPRQQRLFAGRRVGGGLSLAELLVTLAVFLAVGGMGLELILESARATRELTRFQAGVQYCQNALNEAARTLRCAAWPASFPEGRISARYAPRFAADELSVAVCDPGLPSGFGFATLATARSGQMPAGIECREAPLAADPATSAPPRRLNLGGYAPGNFEPSITFAYAAAPLRAGLNGLEVLYLDHWTSATPPALIRITVQARLEDDDGQRRDIALQTAVIPGLLPSDEIPRIPRAAAPVDEAPAEAPARPAASARGTARVAKPARPAAATRGTAKAAKTPRGAGRATKAAHAAAAVKNTPTPATVKVLKVLPAKEPVKVINRAKLDKIRKKAGP